MPFEETVFRAAAPVRADVMASVSGARADTLVLTLSITEKCANDLGIGDKDKLRILIGSGVDQGKLRLIRDSAGRGTARKIGRGGGVLVIHCGNHASFDKPREKSACPSFQRNEKAKAIDIVLPNEWPEKPFRKPGGGKAKDKRDSTATPVTADPEELPGIKLRGASIAVWEKDEIPGVKSRGEPERPAPCADEIAAKSLAPVTYNGLTVSFARNAEKVTLGKKSIDVTARQALAIARLANKMGTPVGRSWLMNEVFPGKSAAEVHKDFDLMIRDIVAAVPPLGLLLVQQSAPGGGTTYSLMRRRQ